MDWEKTSLEKVVAATTKAVNEYILVLCRRVRQYLRHCCQLYCEWKEDAKGDWRGFVHGARSHGTAKDQHFFLRSLTSVPASNDRDAVC